MMLVDVSAACQALPVSAMPAVTRSAQQSAAFANIGTLASTPAPQPAASDQHPQRDSAESNHR